MPDGGRPRHHRAPRPDARHIRPSDVHELAALLRTGPTSRFNIEGNPTQNLMDFVRSIRPHQVTFVPDAEDQFTSDHGWTLPQDAERLRPLIEEARSWACVSLFMDPDPAAMPWWPRSVRSASSSTPRALPAVLARRAGRRCWRRSPPPQGCFARGPRRQRRPRPQPRQPHRLPARVPGVRRSLSAMR